MKHVLITAGQVYGKLDDNKLVGNRTRGIWAIKFAEYLLILGYKVSLVVPDIMQFKPFEESAAFNTDRFKLIKHNGYDSYRNICIDMADKVHAAVMAAAVVNWIPEKPFKGKMPVTEERMFIPFILAPKVINEMKKVNPYLTLIGGKMTIDADHEDLIEAAYSCLLASKANLIVANDMGKGLKTKYLVYQDRTVFTYNNNFDSMYCDIVKTIEDEHYRTITSQLNVKDDRFYPEKAIEEACIKFDSIVNEYRDRFFKPVRDKNIVFGSVLVRINGPSGGYLVSPREKGEMFTSKDAALVEWIERHHSTINVAINSKCKASKASLNAPLLIRVAEKYNAKAVLHLHEQLTSPPACATVSYAPPGTVRDNNREDIYRCFNIEGHGFVKVID